MAIVQRDWLQEIEDGRMITSVEMQVYANRLGTQREFTARELAAALGFAAVSSVYALVDAGAIGYINKGRGTKRYCVFPRESVLCFLQRRCNQLFVERKERKA